MSYFDFEFLRSFLRQRSGLALSPDKKYLLESRLAPVCRQHGIDNLANMVLLLRGGRCPDLERDVVEAMTTNETFFFRDKLPFDLFSEVLLPRYLAARASTRRLRIWCAAASTGQEPYSIAMLIDDAQAKLAGWRVDILATDISTAVLEKARAGVYNQFEVQRGLPERFRQKHFTRIGDQWQISSAIRSMVEFRQLNLIQPFCHTEPFDIIYCRNVLIYFDRPTKADVLRRLSSVLQPDGSMILGASETVVGLVEGFAPDAVHRYLYGKAT